MLEVGGRKSEVGGDGIPLVYAVPGIHFGYFFPKLFLVTFHEAAADDNPLAFVPGLLQDGIDAFFFGVADEAAGVDDDGVAVVEAAVEMNGVPLCFQFSGEVFAIDGVFAAAEGDDVGFQGSGD